VTEILQFIILGLGSAAIYAFAAFGIVVIHRGTGTLNFAYGATSLMCAEIFISADDRMPFALAALLTLLFGIALNVAIAVLVMRPLAKGAPVTRLLATLGLFALFQEITVTVWGPNPRTSNPYLPLGLWHLTGTLIVLKNAGTLMLLAVVLCAALTVFYAKSRFGALSEAAAENPFGAAALGHSPNTLSAVSWAAGGLLAAVTGIVVVPVTGVTPLPLALVILPAFAAALLGGLRSFPIVLIGAVLVGCGQSLTTRYVGSNWSDALPFLIIMVLVTARSSLIPQRADVAERLPNVAGGPFPARRLLGGAAALVGVALLAHGGFALAVDTTLLAGLVALSLVVLTGFAGQVSLAQYALVGIGALVTARAGTSLGMPFLVAALMGVIVAAVAGIVLGLPAVRARGVALAVVTLGMGIAVSDLVFSQSNIVGQVFGTSTGNPSIFGWSIVFNQHPQRYGTVLALAFGATAAGVAAIRRSAFGRRLLAVRDNERAAAGMGIRVVRSKAIAFAVAAAIAGLSGALLIGQYPSIDYTTLTYQQSLLIVLLAVVGGIGWVSGSLLAGLFVPAAVLAYIVSKLTGVSDSSNALVIISSAGLILTLVLNPDGMASGFRDAALRYWPKSRSKVRPAFVVDDRDRANRVRPTETLRVDGLSVSYGGIRALDDVSLSIVPGQILGVIGPNGAGKTTLLDAISGVAPSEGSIRLGSADITRMGPAKRARSGIARTFQGVDLFEDLNVAENISVGMARAGRRRERLAVGSPRLSPLIVDLASTIGLQSHMGAGPAELSGGARRFAGLLRAVAQGQPVLMLDEPAASLDHAERASLARTLRRLARDEGLAILLVEHDVDLVIEVSDKVLAIDFGKQIFCGGPQEVRADDAVRRAYLGLSAEEPLDIAMVQEPSADLGPLR
jgi:ABC-type branched-subunit amino acid transport system ATPase component/branched-subunit amino acid ABC-type transport system permease component